MMSDWDKLDAEYAGGKAVAKPADEWDALDASVQKQPLPLPRPTVQNVDKLPKHAAGFSDRSNAAMAGVNRGFFSDLAGLPVDTFANVVDLVKAGAGSAYGAVTGKTPSDLLDPTDRSTVPLSSQWIADRFNDVGLGGAINNANPDDGASRLLFSAGRGAGASIVPVRSLPISLRQNALNMGAGAVGGAAAGTAAEMTDDPAKIAIAGMLPTLAGRGIVAATKGAVRGGEAGRVAMEQRMMDLKNGGVETPSVGLASGNKFFQGLENLSSNTPGAVGMYDKARQAVFGGMQNKTRSLAEKISPDRGAVESGLAIQNDITGAFKNRFKDAQSSLYDRVDKMIPSDARVPVSKSIGALGDLTAGIDGAPHLGDRFINGKISSINDAMRLDTGQVQKQGSRTATNSIPGVDAVAGDAGRVPISVTRTINPRAGSLGERSVSSLPKMNAQNTPKREAGASDVPSRTATIVIPAVPASPGIPARPAITVTRNINPNSTVAGEGAWKPNESPQLPYKAVSKLRTQVGKELDGNMLTSDVPRSQWKQLYGALSEDIGGAAAATGPKATQAWERANDYTKKGITRLEDLQTLAGKTTPEAAHNTLANSLNAGPTAYERVRNSVTPATRQKFVSTVVDDMGAATPGQQGAAGTDWSPKTFLTNYNKLDPKAKQALFTRLPGGKAHADALADIAKTADMVTSANKVWANPSGTAAATASTASLGALTVGALFNPLLAAKVGTGLALNATASKALLLNPKFVTWLAKAKTIKPEQVQSHIQRLIVNAKAAKDPEFESAVSTYLDSVKNAEDNPDD